MSRQWHEAAAAVVMCVGLLGCASTKVETTWVAPGARDRTLSKLMVIGIMPDSQTRYIVEDELHTQIVRAEVLESYSVIGDAEVRDLDRVREAVKRSKVDGVIIVRLVAAERETSYRSAAPPLGPSYGFYDYYNWAWAAIPSPSWAQTDTKVSLEISIFAVEGEQRVWSGRTESVNPESFRRLIIETVAAVRDELSKLHLIG